MLPYIGINPSRSMTADHASFVRLPMKDGLIMIMDIAIARDIAGSRSLANDLGIEVPSREEAARILRAYDPSVVDAHIIHGKRIVGEPLTISLIDEKDSRGSAVWMIKALHALWTKENVEDFIQYCLDDDPRHYEESKRDDYGGYL